MGFQTKGSKYARKLAQRGVTDIEEQILRRGLTDTGQAFTEAERGIAKSALREIGGTKALRFLLKANAFIKKRMNDDKLWREVFNHLKDHFVPQPGKPSHTVFEESYRSYDAVKKLIETAVDQGGNYSRRLSRRTVEGARAGMPTAQIEIQLDRVIGRTTRGEECRILRIITDLTGRPITAFPATEFEVILR